MYGGLGGPAVNPSAKPAAKPAAKQCATPRADGRVGIYTTGMSIRDEDIVVLKPAALSKVERFYLNEAFKGFGTTLRHFFTSFGQGETSRAMQYPEQRREDMPVEEGGMEKSNFRGFHRLNRDEEGRVKCVACMMCPTICPANCIHIEAAESPWDDREKYPAKFEIDELRCIFCGMCEEACPVDDRQEADVGRRQSVRFLVSPRREPGVVYARRVRVVPPLTRWARLS